MEKFGTSLVPRYADYPERMNDYDEKALRRYGDWLGEQVRAWNPEEDAVADLRDLIEEVNGVLGELNLVTHYGGGAEEFGIDLTSLPSIEDIPGIDTAWPVWAMSRGGLALVGEGADEVTTITDLILRQNRLDEDEPILSADLPEPVRGWFLDSDTYAEDAEGYVYDPEQQERPTWGEIVEQYGYKVWGIVP